MLEFLNITLQDFIKVLGNGYEVLLEADVQGWLFSIFANNSRLKINEVHLSTRVSKMENFFYDIAIGEVKNEQRPCINPTCLIEIKCFPVRGFTDQQHRVHFEHVINDDLVKLGKANNKVFTVEVLFDGKGYLQGTYYGENRLQYLINKRNAITPNTKIVLISNIEGWTYKFY